MKISCLIFLTVLVLDHYCIPSNETHHPSHPDELPTSLNPPGPDEVATSLHSTGGKTRPPPPPGAVNRTIQYSADGPVYQYNTRWIWDANCKDDRSPFELGRWIQVTHDECPIAFEDPNFHSHEYFCE